MPTAPSQFWTTGRKLTLALVASALGTVVVIYLLAIFGVPYQVYRNAIAAFPVIWMIAARLIILRDRRRR